MKELFRICSRVLNLQELVLSVIFRGLFLIFCAVHFICPLHAESVSEHTNNTPLLRQIETYLNKIKTLKASFEQSNPDGSLQSGLFFLQRPGKMRLKYNPPAQHIIISDGNFLIFYNPDLDERTNVPLDATPAEFLVKDEVNLSRDTKILDIVEGDNTYRVTLARQEDPDSGTLTLVFETSPLALKEWIIQDQNDSVTHVILKNLQEGVTLPSALFTPPSF